MSAGPIISHVPAGAGVQPYRPRVHEHVRRLLWRQALARAFGIPRELAAGPARVAPARTGMWAYDDAARLRDACTRWPHIRGEQP